MLYSPPSFFWSPM